MRHWLIALAALALAAPAEGQTPGAAGAYAAERARDASDCANLCAADGICVAWAFRASPQPMCELAATAPIGHGEGGAVTGLSPRAPAFARRLLTPAGAEKAAPAPVVTPTEVAQTADPAAMLLGAPKDVAELPLRSRLEIDPLAQR